jgi:hypothetical protein
MPSISRRVALHQQAVGERARIAFVGIAGNVFLRRWSGRHGLPFDPRRKCRPAATAQAGVQHLLDDGFGRHGRSGPEALPAAMGLVVLQAQRIDDAHARKSQRSCRAR